MPTRAEKGFITARNNLYHLSLNKAAVFRLTVAPWRLYDILDMDLYTDDSRRIGFGER